MAEASIELADDGEDSDDPSGRAVVVRRMVELRDFLTGLSLADFESGEWFTKLCMHALRTYTAKVDADYLLQRNPGMPADILVDQRIKLATRHAAIAGAVASSVYSGIYLSKMGPRGGAGSTGAATLAAGGTSTVGTLAFVARLQLRLAWDIAVLYRVPPDLGDPEELGDFVRVALGIKIGELRLMGTVTAAAPLTRKAVKKVYSGKTLKAAKDLPIIGEHLRQKTVMRTAIPVVVVPLAIQASRAVTQDAGEYAREVFGAKAKVLERAERLIRRTRHVELLLWVAWLVIEADQVRSDEEYLLMRHLLRLAEEQHQHVDKQLEKVIKLDLDDVWERVAAASGDLNDVVDAARKVAEVDGPVNEQEKVVLDELRDRCRHEARSARPSERDE
jgi:tellurite resistance protein